MLTVLAPPRRAVLGSVAAALPYLAVLLAAPQGLFGAAAVRRV